MILWDPMKTIVETLSRTTKMILGQEYEPIL